MMPSARQITTAAEGLFTMFDWHSFGSYYDPTLMAWNRNFVANWDTIAKLDFDEPFRRMWNFYLSYCDAGFTDGRINVGQFQVSKP